MMKNPKRLVSVFLAVIVLVISSCSEEKSRGNESNKVAASLEDKLIELKGGKISDAKIPADVDYYVLYHSASW
jgi:hypothetical protein